MSLADLDLSSSPARAQGRPYVVIGGGPAGLTAGYLLAKEGKRVIVLEADDQVGGLAKTVVDPDGYRFDLGGHRFFTKSKEVNDLWLEIMGDEFLMRPRQSRIFWRGKFLDYPLRGADVVKKLGPIELPLCLLSYLWAAIKPKGPGGQRRAVGLQPLRQAPLQPLLQVLHREGVGRADHGAARRVGRPAHQGPVLLQRRQGRLLRQPRRQDQVADRPVPVPALRPGPDVGADDDPHRGARRRGPARTRRRRSLEIASDGDVIAVHTPRRGHRAEGRDLVAAAARDGRDRRPAGARARPRRRPGPALPRLPDGRARARRRGRLPRQLDLHPRAGRQRRPHPELPVVEPVDGPRPGHGLRRPRVLLLRGRRPVEHGRRRPHRARDAPSSSSSASRRPPRSAAATSSASRRRIRCTTRTTPSASTSSRAGSPA